MSAVGISKSGKSFLLSQLLGLEHGFTVGPTVDATTFGVWMWSKPLLVNGTWFLFLDSEGFFAQNVSEVSHAHSQ